MHSFEIFIIIYCSHLLRYMVMIRGRLMHSPPQICPWSQFNIGSPWHKAISPTICNVISKWYYLISAAKSYDELLSLSVYIRDRVNPHMFTYALSVVLLHRSDTRNLKPPSHVEMFPNLYIDGTVFGKAKEESSVVAPGQRVSNQFIFFSCHFIPLSFIICFMNGVLDLLFPVLPFTLLSIILLSSPNNCSAFNLNLRFIINCILLPVILFFICFVHIIFEELL